MRFVDTNILVYIVDKRDVSKRQIAKAVLSDAMSDPTRYLFGAQTLAEFSNVCLGKFKMSEETVSKYLSYFLEFKIVDYNARTVIRALEIKKLYDLQFYDSLLLATAEANGCTEFLSEDLNDGQIYCGMKAVNPFKTAQEGEK